MCNLDILFEAYPVRLTLFCCIKSFFQSKFMFLIYLPLLHRSPFKVNFVSKKIPWGILLNADPYSVGLGWACESMFLISSQVMGWSRDHFLRSEAQALEYHTHKSADAVLNPGIWIMVLSLSFLILQMEAVKSQCWPWVRLLGLSGLWIWHFFSPFSKTYLGVDWASIPWPLLRDWIVQ